MVTLEIAKVWQPGTVFLHPVVAALLAGEIIADKGSSHIGGSRAPPVKKVNRTPAYFSIMPRINLF
ncbi:unnamed protein product, partial [marine sediment metagenome]